MSMYIYVRKSMPVGLGMSGADGGMNETSAQEIDCKKTDGDRHGDVKTHRLEKER